LGANQLKVLALSTMLTTVGVATAAQQPDPSTTQSTSIRGVVRYGDQPAPRIEIRAHPRGPGTPAVTRTDEHGAYAFNTLKPGSYVISFVAVSAPKTLLSGSWDVAVEVCSGTTLVLDSAPPPQLIGEVVVTRPNPGTLSGRVTSQNFSDGLSGAQVRLLRPADGSRLTTKTDISGRYSFAGLAPGHYELSGAAPGFLTRSRGVDLNAQSPERVSAPGSSPSQGPGDIALCPRQAVK
jgi:hypothetical protein